MASTTNSIITISGASGIDEAFARRFHTVGKKVIVAGRREEQLRTLSNELKALETVQVCTP